MKRFIKLLYNRIFRKSNRNNIAFVNFLFQKILGINKDFPIEAHYTTIISSPQNIKFKGGIKFIKSMSVSGNCYFSAYNGIEFGYNVLFAPSVKIISSNHDFSADRKPLEGQPVIIGDNVWLGTGVVILPEVNIGENCIVAAGAVVSKSFGKNLIIGGVPAKVLGGICSCGNRLKKSEGIYFCEKCGEKYKLENNNLISL